MEIINDNILKGIQECFPKPCFECFGQVSFDDRALYYWTAKEYFTGAGTIVDAGALVGSTSMCFGYGINDNEKDFLKADVRIHVYDLFSDDNDGYSADSIRNAYYEQKTDIELYDFEHHFRRNTQSIEEYLEIHKGDITKIGYTSDKPIEILSIDVAKTPALMHYVATEFYPKLIPGHSLVLHQDFLFPYQPWLHVAQYMLEEYFDRIYDVPTQCTTLFKLKKPITKENVLGILGENLTDYYKPDNARYIQKSFEQSRQPIGELVVKGAYLYFYFMQGDIAKAQKLIPELYSESDLEYIRQDSALREQLLQQLLLNHLQIDILKDSFKINEPNQKEDNKNEIDEKANQFLRTRQRIINILLPLHSRRRAVIKKIMGR